MSKGIVFGVSFRIVFLVWNQVTVSFSIYPSLFKVSIDLVNLHWTQARLVLLVAFIIAH